jgi:phosphopantothenoylcysteine decarboxylase / phosphopantothenate---cysteine ligase
VSGLLDGRRIVLGVTGGIAAYKAVEVCRKLVDAGAHVSPVLTAGARHFVGETTFSALASEPVQTSLWDEQSPIPHTRLGQNADLVLVCPATARLVGAYAAGISNDLLTATLLATAAPVVVCPAMHTEMWEHPAVEENIATLRRRGVRIVEPEAGRLAGGDSGKGRLASPASIFAVVEQMLQPQDLAGESVLVTAGGTREAIDPVRYIGNRSSGKQGHAVAEAAHARGAKVTLVTTSSLASSPGIERVQVESAAEMQSAVDVVAAQSDIIVMAAAVADFRPVVAADQKIKKHSASTLGVTFEVTPDILAALGEAKSSTQYLVGFAAETQDLLQNAEQKLVFKNLDLIVANDVSAPDTGFEHDTNAVTIISRGAGQQVLSLRSKRDIAEALLDVISARSPEN